MLRCAVHTDRWAAAQHRRRPEPRGIDVCELAWEGWAAGRGVRRDCGESSRIEVWCAGAVLRMLGTWQDCSDAFRVGAKTACVWVARGC